MAPAHGFDDVQTALTTFAFAHKHLSLSQLLRKLYLGDVAFYSCSLEQVEERRVLRRMNRFVHIQVLENP